VTRPKKVRMTSLKILTKASVLVYKNFKYTSSAQKSHKELTLIHENSKTPQICGLPPFAKHRGRPIAGPGPAHSRRRFIARFGDRLDHGRIPGHRRGRGSSQRQQVTVQSGIWLERYRRPGALGAHGHFPHRLHFEIVHRDRYSATGGGRKTFAG